MKRALLVLALIACGCHVKLKAQGFRIDPPPVMTTAGNVNPGGFPALYAVAGAGINVCLDAACSTPATTYTSGALSSSCPTYAPIVLAGTSSCTTATGPQGQFGFWLPAGTYYYQVVLPSGQVFGNYPLTTNTVIAGVSSVIAGTGISVSGATGNVTISATANGVTSFGPSGAPRTGVVTTQIGDYSYSQISGPIQGTGAKPQMAGANSGTAGAVLCDDASGNATTSGCTIVAQIFAGTGIGVAGTTVSNTGVLSVNGNTGVVSGLAPLASPTFTGTVVTPNITVTSATGSIQCAQFSAGGQLVASGAGACGGGGGGGGANTALSNLATVSINTALLFQASVDIGATGTPARNLFLYGSGAYGTNYVELTGAPSGTRVLTLPDRTANVATSSGSLTNGHCVSIDASGNFVDAGGACTTGGGGGTVSSSTSGFMTYYTGTGTVVGGEGDFTYTSASHTIAGGGSSVLDLHAAATSGFFLPGGLATGVVKVTTSTGAVSSLALSGTGTTVGTTTGSLTTGHCVDIDASGNLIDSGGACGGTASGTTPIVVSGGVVSCPTCLITGGGQTISGTDTWTARQIHESYVDFYNGASGPQWSMISDVANTLKWYNSSAVLRMYLSDTGSAVGGGSSASLLVPSLYAQATSTNTPTVTIKQVASQSADYADLVNSAGVVVMQFDSLGDILLQPATGGGSSGGIVTVGNGTGFIADATSGTRQSYVTGNGFFLQNASSATVFQANNSTGLVSTYGGITTAGQGLPTIVYKDSVTGTATGTGAGYFTMATTPSGFYRFSAKIEQLTGPTGCSVMPQAGILLKYADNSTTFNEYIPMWSVAGANFLANPPFFVSANSFYVQTVTFYTSASIPIQWALSGLPGTGCATQGTYNAYVTLEYLYQ